MKSLFFTLVFLTAGAAVDANAGSLIYEKCPGGMSSLANPNEGLFILVSNDGGFAGLTCQELKSTLEAAQILGMVLMPVSVALSTPGVREQVFAELAGLGLTLANPAVLGVTVLGSVGFVTVYFVMKESLRECEQRERDQFKKDLIEEIRLAYPGVLVDDAPLEIRN
jgi:hypothetical protein